MRNILRDPQPVLDELRETYGPVVGLGAGPMRMAIVGEPDALRELFSTPVDAFKWGHKFNVLGFVVGDGSMIVSDGPDHKRRRASVLTAFSRRRLNGWIPTIVALTDEAIDELGAPTVPVDMYRFGRKLILHIVVRTIFGARMAERADEFGDLFERPQAYLESPALRQLPHRIPYTRRARVRADRAAIDAIIDGEIAHHRANPETDPESLLAALVTNEGLSDAEIRDQVVTLIGAGYDTTSASLAWMLWRATLTPGVWDRLRSEADQQLGDTVDEAVLARLEYANHVMRETLRLHPAGVIAPREAATDVAIGKYTITKGTLILWSAYLAGRDPEAWPEPLRFDPDRFADADARTRAETAWVPFGRGARNCIGFALAQMELTLIIARVAQRLDLVPVTSTVPRPVGMVVNRPEGGAPMRVTVRKEEEHADG